MRATTLTVSLLAATATARYIDIPQQQPLSAPEELYLVETGPGQTEWISEDQKWELRRVKSKYSKRYIQDGG